MSLHLILSVAYLIDRRREQKKEMHASFVEFRRPSPPSATGVDATNHEWSGKFSFSLSWSIFVMQFWAILSDFSAKGVLFETCEIVLCARIDANCK